ncbi:tetratricopeptide repeat protein [Stieleria sp. ICT_E10.1]|uniref:tetratricopeptide repeat protein n=1 Tax=Stieleria sedimenti TaxID=2976331 RepID=UPI00217FA620|nr:tetratricopeptide repeat protein [Stieleria sedimenti]MCS7471619.1 tetratricopeptide repeat protein [Stieleria sedimenti]
MTRPLSNRAPITPFVRTVGLLSLLSMLIPLSLGAQDSEELSNRERVAADRYLQVLLRRPRPGVSLDRVYGYHVQNDSLDELEKQLSDPQADDAGERQMVWGLVQLQRGRAAEAAQILTAAESKLPDDAACSFYLGRAYLAVGQTEQAAAAMERALDRGPSRAEALPMFTQLGRIYSRAGQREKSLAVWTRLEQLFPGDTRVGGQIARTLAEEGNYEEALRRYEQLAQRSKQPDEKIAMAVQAAEMRRRMGNADEATELLEKILARLNPGSWLHTDVRNRIEAGFLKSGDYDALADYYKQQLADRSDDLSLQTRLARILITAGRLSEAKTLLDAVVARAPDDTEARSTLIDVLINQNNVAEAAEQFSELAKRDADNPDHLVRWGQVLLEDTETPLEQRRDAAADVWSRLADTRSDDAVTLSQVADLMRGIDRSEDAIELYRKSIDLDPGSPQYREYLGEYLHSLDRKDDAVEVWQSIAEGDRRGRESLVRLAEVFGAFKLPALALDTWGEAAEYDLTFAQELRYASKLTEAKQYENALKRLDAAATIAETPDEQEQLLKDRIAVYQASGTLEQQIRQVEAGPETADSLRTLALMHSAAGDLVNAERSIQHALKMEPDNTDVLLVAADLAERQNRLSDAAELFEQLATADSRFRTNYLQRVAGLQVRLGQTDQAIETCEAVIDANPASPESYQFYARTAFGVNRDEEAIAALRRAMTVAPRDNSPRRMLASHFADQYRTDEAIELYWQALNYEVKLDDKINVIRALAPLYDRKTDLQTLLGRIEEINRKDGNARATSLMVAAAHESVQDFGAAISAIDQLLAVQPRDVALLETMVRLADAANEVEQAAEYQQRITELANTPENRFKLVEYQLEAGTIDVAQALSQRLSFLSDPSRLGGMVRSAARRGDLKTARAICEEALRADDSLWDIKLSLAQLLLMDRSGDDAEANRERAMQLAKQIRAADVPMDAPAPTRRKQTNTTVSSNGVPAGYQSNPMYWSQASYQLAQMLRVGRYANASYSSSTPSATIEATSFGHARVIAASLVLMNELIGLPDGQAADAVQAKLDSEFSVEDWNTVTDPMEIWEQFALMNVMSLVSNQPVASPFGPTPPNLSAAAKAKADALRQNQMKMMWRLAELDRSYGMTPLLQFLSQRMMADSMPAERQPDMTPLTEKELEILASINERVQASGMSSAALMGAPPGAAEMMFQAILGHEFNLAGQEEKAAQFAPEPPGADASYDEIVGAIQFYLRLGKPEQADGLVKRLLPAARREKPKAPVQGFSPITQIMMGGGEAAKAFNERHERSMVDAVIAGWAKSTLNAASRSTTLGDGYVNTYAQTGSGGFRSVRIRGPLSPRLLDSTLAQQVLAFSATDSDASANQAQTLSGQPQTPTLSADLIGHLQTPLSDAPLEERKTRRVVAAYAHWWAGRPEKCYEQLVDLCAEFPSDVDLQIERARLASELKQPRLALETLDSFSPLDSRMLVRKEMAAMNLAAEIGDTERAKVAAERLFGMRLDVQMQLALADQLKRLGLNDQANAMLARTRSGRVRDENTELQIARAFLSAGDKEAAAEVAYSLMRRLSSGRSQRSNQSYYQQQVVSILQSAGRLEPLIERAKRRVESSPKAIRPKQELAELYVAAGRGDEANQVWEDLSEDVPVNAAQMIARADAMVKAKRNADAVKLYLDAFEKDPSRLNNDYYKMSNAARSAGEETIDEMYRRLIKIPVESIPTYRMDELARLGSRSTLSDAKRKFIAHLLKSPAAQAQVYNIVRNLPDEQRKQIPEYREAILSAACSNDSFSANSQLWNVNSRSSGGFAIGPLADTLVMIQTDADANQRFRQAAEIAKDMESYRLGATFLLALVDTDNAEKVPDSLASMRACIERQPDEPSNTPTVCSGLLWQAGQVLENVDGVPADFLIDLYQEAKRSSTSSSSSPQYTLDHRLIETYKKAERFDEARALLLEIYRVTDFSSQNQYNPGYGDYQQLQLNQWVAEQLLACNSPVDALIVYHAALSKPERFESAARWGGSRASKETFENGANATAEKITPEVAANHLIRQVEGWEKDVEANPVELMEASAETILASDSPSSLGLAIRVAVADEEARGTVAAFAEKVGKLAERHSDSWQLAALQLMTACYLGDDSTAPLAETLFARLPAESELTDENNQVVDRVKATALFDLYPVARAAGRSENKTDQEIGARLVRYMSKVAESANDSSIALALAEISGDASQSISRILDLITAQSQPDAPLSQSLVDQCLQVAKDAAKAGEIDTSMRALQLALQNGPPLRKLSTGGDAFAITSSRNSAAYGSREQQTEMDQLADKVAAITDGLSQAIGVPFEFKLSSYQSDRDRQIDRQAMSRVADAYLEIFAPANRPGTVFNYSKKIATSSYDRIRSDDDIVVSSASMVLATAAAACGRADELAATLEKRLASADHNVELSIALVQLAFAAGNMERLAASLDRMMEAIGKELPPPGQRPAGTGPLTTITSQMASESQKKSEVVDRVMHAIWPIVASDLISDAKDKGGASLADVSKNVAELLRRTESLIGSDSYTANRHREIRRRLALRYVAIAKASGDIEVIDDYIQSELDTIETQPYPSGVDLQDYKRRALERLAVSMIDDGLTEQMDPVFRQAITEHFNTQRNYSNRFESHVCLAISQLPADKRIELLEKLTFGRDGDYPIAYFDALVSYEIPPPLVRRQHPMLDAVINLPTSTGDYPVVNSLVMLIDAAVAAGQTGPVLEKLQRNRKTVGDEADMAAALLKLAAAKSNAGETASLLNEIAPTLRAVGDRLAKNLPKQNDKSLRFPALETHLIVRAFEAGLPVAIAEPMIRNVKVYAIRGQRNFMVSAVARATAAMGVGRAAGATTDSPLEHFNVVPISARYRGDNVLLPPLYAVGPDGWISGTSGYEQSHLMFKYPLSGSFTFSAEIQDGGWGEADVAYGGVIYQGNGWQQTAKILGMGNRGQVEFKVGAIRQGKPNVEAVSVSADRVQALCNGEPYVSDTVTGSFPFVSIHHHKYRTTHFRDVRFSGSPTIPDEVDLIDPTMRGWGVLTRGKSIPKMLLPIGPKQNEQSILKFREKMQADLANGPLADGWSVREGKLHYNGKPADSGSRASESASHIEYLRPIQDGESIEIEFYWKTGETEFSPTIGRTVMRLGPEGTTPDWIIANGDLASVGFINVANVDPPYSAIAADNVPNDEAWNTLVMSRDGDQLTLTLNAQPLTAIPVQGHERPGLYRHEKCDVTVRKIRLTGDWPDQVPAELMAR